MFKKYPNQMQVSFGLLVGYLLAAIVHVMISEVSLKEALTDEKLIFLIAGIGLSLYSFYRKKWKERGH